MTTFSVNNVVKTNYTVCFFSVYVWEKLSLGEKERNGFYCIESCESIDERKVVNLKSIHVK